MADNVRLTKNGLRAYKWNPKLRDAAKERGESTEDNSKFYDVYEPEGDKIWSFLRTACEIDEGVTILDVFNVVDKYPLLKIFLMQYSWCKHLDDFHKQAVEPFVKDESDDDLEYAEIYAQGDIHDGDLDTYYDFHAYGGPPKGDNYVHYKPDQKVAYSISYSPSNRYANLPLRLNTSLTVFDWDRKDETGGPVEAFKGSKSCLSLLEVLDAIYWDISFMGGPSDNKLFMDDLADKVGKIKSGELKTVPFDFDDLDEN